MLPSFRAVATALALGAFALGALAACAESPLAPAASSDGARPSVRAVPPAAATIAVVGCDGDAVALSPDEKRTLDLHAETRRALGLPGLCVDATLTAAARAHSQEMLERGYFSHDSFDGQTFDQRIRGLGYPSQRGLAENVAWGSGSMGDADDVYGRWMASDAHHHNIVDPALRQVGVGVAAGTYLWYDGARMYTVDFGTR